MSEQELEKIFDASWQFGPEAFCFIAEPVFPHNPVEVFPFVFLVKGLCCGLRIIFQVNLN